MPLGLLDKNIKFWNIIGDKILSLRLLDHGMLALNLIKVQLFTHQEF